jgi:hypothetical protein
MTTYDGGAPTVSMGCTINSCGGGSLDETCTGTSNGLTTNEHITAMISSTGYTGTVTLTITEADGGIFENCTYTATATKD